MNRQLVVIILLAFGAFVVACGTTDEPEVAPPTTTTELPASATDAPGGGPPNAPELVARAEEAMDQQSFRGGWAFAPSQPESAFTYAPGLTLLQDMGGEWARYILLSDKAAFYSGGGARWLTSDEDPSFRVFLGVVSDPRVALRFASTPEIVEEEAIDGRTHLIVSTGLDAEAILDMTPPQEPHVRIIMGFPYPEGADARELEGLGYEVFGSLLKDSAEWEAFKGPYQLRFSERANQPGQPRDEWKVWITVIVREATALEASAKQELRAALEAYGADPDLIENARVMPVVQDAGEEMRQQLQDLQVRLWIDVETGLIRRLGIGPVSPDWDEYQAIGFWGYGDDIHLQVPADIMDSRRADALDGVAKRGFHALNEALRHHEAQHGRYPDALTPETVGDALEALGFVWPTNPFNDAPMRHTPGTPGDFRYTGYGDDYALEVHGWDLPTAGRKAEFGEVEEAPKPNTLEEDLDYVRSLDFPVFWLGLRSGEPAQNEVELPALTLTEAAACPPEPVCIWPVRFAYGTAQHGSRLLSFLERPRGESDIPKGEQTQIAGLEAIVLVTEDPLPHRADLSVWRATVWLPESVIRIAATTITEDPEGNPFNSEIGLTAAVGLLMELR